MKAILKKIAFVAMMAVGILASNTPMNARAILFTMGGGGPGTIYGHAQQTGGSLDGVFSFRCTSSPNTCIIHLGDGLYMGDFLVGYEGDPLINNDLQGEYIMDAP